jgi:catechol 2,3-dioxygenase-like lactoylglutathione lyase family enzyme
VLKAALQLTYVLILCEDIEGMKAFYRGLFDYEVDSESATGLALRAGNVLLALRKRTRGYDGSGLRTELPGVQVAFLVADRNEVDSCYQELLTQGVTILEPPTDQPRGHRTIYFADPEGNQLEIYAEIEPF